MFSIARIVSTAQLLASPRFFSTTAVAQKYKLKSHHGAKKRFKSIASGAFKRAHAGLVHKNVHKSPARKTRLGQTAYTSGSQTALLKKMLPYGSS
ncbi:hypothetical protein WOLCODRAFT_136618 [Wolfiporia cocos MD-104 SS10]|uniref:50S ribosomal protein L35 n=1 Tax=Wolfiporia cocos (strain MD-104) TaxID=742152 RepID=A0A2H3JCQ7_WOLCO|nr:hypothetical protein WOLCODRAFT_136618 [Wolfiporia cocos MD-104 SS10]